MTKKTPPDHKFGLTISHMQEYGVVVFTSRFKFPKDHVHNDKKYGKVVVWVGYEELHYGGLGIREVVGKVLRRIVQEMRFTIDDWKNPLWEEVKENLPARRRNRTVEFRKEGPE